MRNLTNYNDLFIRNLIEQAGGNYHRCTANIQYAVQFNRLVPVLVIYQDYNTDWDNDDRELYCKKTETIDFCDDMHLDANDLKTMIEYYKEVAFQKIVNDIEYEIEYTEYLNNHFNWK